MASFQPQVNLTGLGMTLQRVADLPKNSAQEKKFMPFRLEEISPEGSLYKEIVTDFENADMKVNTIKSLQNTMKLNAYRAHRDTLYDERSKLDSNFKLNEKYLYHGTAANVIEICEVGLDDKLSGNGCFGKGIYFSDNPRKCVKYANRVNRNQGLILCARVILGDAKVYPKGKVDRALLREPQKAAGSIKGWRFYDSVQGCPKDFQEFVVYRGTNLLVEYLITYSKSSVKKKAPDCQNEHSSKSSQVASDLSHTNKMSLEGDMAILPTRLIPSPVVNLDAASSSSDSDEEKQNYRYNGSDTSSDEDQEERIPIICPVVADNDTDCSETDSDTEGNDMNCQIKANTTHFENPGIAENKELLLARKKLQFSTSTGELSECLVETFLQASDFDVARAVNMYHSKKKEDAETERKYLKELEAGEDDNKEDEAVGGDLEPLFIQGKTVPDCNSPQWSLMTETDKEAVMTILIDNFLSITSLTETQEPVARHLLRLTNYDLDAAIVAYYESI